MIRKLIDNVTEVVACGRACSRARVCVRSECCPLVYTFFTSFPYSLAPSLSSPLSSLLICPFFQFSAAFTFFSRFPFTNLYTLPFTHQMNAVSVCKMAYINICMYISTYVYPHSTYMYACVHICAAYITMASRCSSDYSNELPVLHSSPLCLHARPSPYAFFSPPPLTTCTTFFHPRSSQERN